jgi:hypothetical protein
MMFRDHTRLILGTAAMALVIGALCLPPTVQSVTKPVFVDTPANVDVTEASSSSIKLTWDVATGAAIYNIERSESMSGPFSYLTSVSSPTTTYTDTDVVTTHSYIYRVRGLGAGNVSSGPSNMAAGTAISFEFDKLIDNQGGQVIRREVRTRHFNDVRTAINAMRFLANMPPAIWARQNLNGLEIQAGDVKELRDRLVEALLALHISPPNFNDPNLATGANGTPVRATHLEQLQVASTRGKSSSAGPLYSNNVSRALAGEFSGVIDLPLVPVHLSVLPDKRILFWGRDYARNAQQQVITDSQGRVKQAGGHSDTYVGTVGQESFSGVIKRVNSTTNLFCSGHSFLPDGTLFVTGGHQSPHFDLAGEDHTNIFNYKDNTWTAGPTMVHGRWYPYNVTLGTGETLVMAGSFWSNVPPPPFDPYDPTTPMPTDAKMETNFIPQIYTPGTGSSLKNLAEPPGPPPNSGEPPGPRLTNYPYLHLTSEGKVFQAQSGFFTNPNNNVSTVEKQSRLLDPRANTWTSLADAQQPHDRGSSVLFEGNKVLLVGGFDNSGTPTTGTEYFNLDTAAWTVTTPMRFPRSYHTATVLPNGKVLVTGGVSCKGRNSIELETDFHIFPCSAGGVLTPELWDPITKQWTLMAPQNELRAYHSVAALLPDGRVLVGGGGLPGAIGEIGINGIDKITDDQIKTLQLNAMLSGHANFEIFSPPYLFNSNGTVATRPAITSAPDYVSNGETFFVGTSAISQPKVSLVRLPSVTHGFNQDQRLISLLPSPTNGGLYVTAPVSPNVCPPGYYMLFVLNEADVPSMARIIRVQNAVLFPVDMPVTSQSGGGPTWEQGVEFSSVIDGQITHIRFWKASGEPNGHVGHIWNAATGVELASVQFVNETASGWQEAQLTNPLPITAGARYRVTYNIHSLVAKTFGTLDSPVMSWPLVGWASYFSTPAGSFPTTFSGSNLFADVRMK